MNDNPAHQVFTDLLSYFESLEAQTGAILQFLKEKGIASEEQLAPYLEQAGSAASVKWRAVRVRMEHLFALSKRTSEESAPKQVSAEGPTKTKTATKEVAKESPRGVPKKNTEVLHAPSKEPARKSEAQAGTGNVQPGKDVAAKSPAESPSLSEEKTSGESKHSEVDRQKAS